MEAVRVVEEGAGALVVLERDWEVEELPPNAKIVVATRRGGA